MKTVQCPTGFPSVTHLLLSLWPLLLATVSVDASRYDLSVTATIDGQSATAPPGIERVADSSATATYILTNTGRKDLQYVEVFWQEDAIDDAATGGGKGKKSKKDKKKKADACTADKQKGKKQKGKKDKDTDGVLICAIDGLQPGDSQSCDLNFTVQLGEFCHSAVVIGYERKPKKDKLKKKTTEEILTYYTGVPGSPGLSALPSAIPTSGNAPLTVTFTPNATTNNAILRYEWDFEGDGVFDRSETVGRDQTFTYTVPGTYNATLRVTDNQNEQATNTVTISVNNEPPVVSIDLNPSNGQVPLTVSFTATATDSDGIAQFEWDYDGDGIFDETTTVGTASTVYSKTGTFQAQVRVTDTLGATTTLAIPTLAVNALEAGSPSVTLLASPTQGNPPLTVNLSASAVDPDGGTIVQYEWDVDGDGTYDQTTATASLATTYNGIGTLYPRVRVTDSDGQQAEDVIQLFVEPSINLTVSTDTIDPANSETTTITTTLGGDTEISVVIEDRYGQLIRTLVPLTLRTAARYDDSWDGTDEAGNTVIEGEYRVILLYRIDGVLERLDLALTTGGNQSNPPRSGIPSSFSPLAGDPLEITFTLSRASEVTAFMGLFNVNTRLITFLQRQPLGRGSHVVTWNGENSDGQLIEAPPGDRFLFGLFAYTLPDNAIFVRSGVHVNSVSVSPSILQPTQLTAEGFPAVSQIDVALSRAGNVKLTINDADSGATVAELTYTGLIQGSNTITWDGKDNNGDYVAAGTYRLGVAGVDSSGYQSLTVYALQRVFY